MHHLRCLQMSWSSIAAKYIMHFSYHYRRMYLCIIFSLFRFEKNMANHIIWCMSVAFESVFNGWKGGELNKGISFFKKSKWLSADFKEINYFSKWKVLPGEGSADLWSIKATTTWTYKCYMYTCIHARTHKYDILLLIYVTNLCSALFY